MEMLFAGEGGCRIGIAAAPVEVEALVATLEAIARDLGWQPGGQIRDQACGAVCLAAMVGDELAGGLQLVRPDGSGRLPCHAVWPKPDLCEQAVMAHVTILALQPQRRGTGLFWPLCVELWRYCQAHGIASILLEATPPTLRLYRRLGWPLAVVGDLRPHWGEDCFLCSLSIADVIQAVAARSRRSRTYRRIYEQATRPSSPPNILFGEEEEQDIVRSSLWPLPE